MTTLTLHLVRHGQTLFNRRELVQGWVDSPLTERGWRQAEAAAEHLAGRPLQSVYASTSERAVDTASRIVERHPGLSVVQRKALKEMYFGELEARPDSEFFEAIGNPTTFFPEAIAGRGRPVGGGESPADYRARVESAMTEILGAAALGSELVVVSHGVTINVMLSVLGGESPGPIVNGAVTTVSMVDRGGWVFSSLDLWEPGE